MITQVSAPASQSAAYPTALRLRLTTYVEIRANRDGHRRFGNVRKLPSGRYQIRYPGLDGRMRTGPETYERKGEADKALVLIEAQISAGEWTDPERAKIRLGDYASAWIAERPGLRPRTADLYRWLLGKHITPYLGGVLLSELSTRLVREWRATLLRTACQYPSRQRLTGCCGRSS